VGQKLSSVKKEVTEKFLRISRTNATRHGAKDNESGKKKKAWQ